MKSSSCISKTIHAAFAGLVSILERSKALLFLVVLLPCLSHAYIFGLTYDSNHCIFDTSTMEVTISGHYGSESTWNIPETIDYLVVLGKDEEGTTIVLMDDDGNFVTNSYRVTRLGYTYVGSGESGEWREQSLTGVSDLTSVSIPDSVTTIYTFAFYNADKLQTVTIGSGIDDASGIPHVSSAYSLGGDSPYFSVNAGALLNKSGTRLLMVPTGRTGTYRVPNGVTSVSQYAFRECNSIDIILPTSMTAIANDTFSYCRGVQSVSIPNSITFIGQQAFVDCAGLQSISIPDSVTSYGDETFMECSGLKSVSLSSRATSIPYSMFAGCTNLADIQIPENVTSIGRCAFMYCSSLKTVAIPASVVNIAPFAFAYCTKLESVLFLGSPPTGDETAFADCRDGIVGYYLSDHAEEWRNTIDDNGKWNGIPMKELGLTPSVEKADPANGTARLSWSSVFSSFLPGTTYSIYRGATADFDDASCLEEGLTEESFVEGDFYHLEPVGSSLYYWVVADHTSLTAPSSVLETMLASLRRSPPLEARRRFGLAVGPGTFVDGTARAVPHEQHANDATLFSRLATSHGGVKSDRMFTLTGSAAMVERAAGNLEFFRTNAIPGDIVFLFVSTQGRGMDSSGVLSLYDADWKNSDIRSSLRAFDPGVGIVVIVNAARPRTQPSSSFKWAQPSSCGSNVGWVGLSGFDDADADVPNWQYSLFGNLLLHGGWELGWAADEADTGAPSIATLFDYMQGLATKIFADYLYPKRIFEHENVLGNILMARAAGRPSSSKPGPVGNFRATMGDRPDLVHLTWDPESSAVCYIVSRRRDVLTASGYLWQTLFPLVPSSPTEYEDADAAVDGSHHTYRVAAWNWAGVGPWSDDFVGWRNPTWPFGIEGWKLPADSLEIVAIKDVTLEAHENWSAQVIASGVAGPYTWSAKSLPAGLEIDQNGLISGVPVETGEFFVTIRVSVSANASIFATTSFKMTVTGGELPLQIVTESLLPFASRGTAYPVFLEAIGGETPYVWEGPQEPKPTRQANSFSENGTQLPFERFEYLKEYELPFPFPYFGNVYTNCQIRKDSGEILFGQRNDNAHSEEYYLSAPALRVYYYDSSWMLASDQGVFIDATNSTVTIRWKTPTSLLNESGDTDDVNYAVELHSDGRIVLSYGDGAGQTGGVAEAIAGNGVTRIVLVPSNEVPWNGDDYVIALPDEPDAIPTGLSVGADGWIAGVPSVAGTFAFPVTVRSTDGQTATKRFSLTVCPSLARFDANGGEGTMDDVPSEPGKTMILPFCEFVRNGWTFAGWSTNETGTVVFADGGLWIPGTGLTTFYARWGQEFSTVRFDSNGGFGDMADWKSWKDIPASLPWNEFQREGFRFIGWADDPDGAVILSDGGTVENLATPGTVMMLYAVWEEDPIAEAVEGGTLSFVSGGDAPWFVTDETGYSSLTSARSGSIANEQSSWLQTIVTGPGTISFRWMVSSERYWDVLSFEIDGTRCASIDGTESASSWQLEEFSITNAGRHVLRWCYEKDGYGSSGSDCGWIDAVFWAPWTPIGIVTESLPDGVVSRDYGAELKATGGFVPHSWSASGLPAGLSISASGVVSGTPTETGMFSVTVSVEDATGETVSRTFELLVAEMVITTGATLPVALTEEWYWQSVAATGGVEPYTWEIVDEDDWPSWLSSYYLNEHGTLSGTPYEDDIGTYTFTLRVTDAEGTSVERTFTLEVVENPNPPPVLDFLDGPSRIQPGETASFSVEAHDPKGDALTYTWRWCGTDDWDYQEGGTGTSFDFAPSGEGEYYVCVVVSDGVNEREWGRYVTVSTPRTIHVDIASTAGDPDGASWETAYPTLVQGAAEAGDGDTVLVAPGVYAEDAWFQPGVTLRSRDGAATAVLDGEGVRQCVQYYNGNSDAGFTVVGFTLRNGSNAGDSRPAVVYEGTRLENCLIENCIDTSWRGVLYDCDLVNCVVTGNESDGGIVTACRLWNCTVAENSLHGWDAAVVETCSAWNCILWNNADDSGYDNTFYASYGGWDETQGRYTSLWMPALTNCCVAGLETQAAYLASELFDVDFAAQGCFEADPKFVDAANGDFRLRTGSPCLDAAAADFVRGSTDAAGNPRMQGTAVDLGALEGAMDGFVVSVRVVGAGAVSPMSALVSAGGSATFTASESGGRPFRGWTTNGVEAGTVASFTWENVQADGELAATFGAFAFCVDAATGDDANDGLSWATPKATIQAAINVAEAGESVLVKPGVYDPIDTAGKDIRIESTDGASATIIDGGGTNRCAYLGTGSGRGSTLSGFSLRNGNAGWNCSPKAGYGGGAYGGTLLDCDVVGNRAYEEGGGLGYAEAHRCRIVGNMIVDGDRYVYGGGASSCDLYCCLVTSNSLSLALGTQDTWADSCGGGVAWGRLFQCTVVDNSAEIVGDTTDVDATVRGGGFYGSAVGAGNIVFGNMAGGVSSDAVSWNGPSDAAGSLVGVDPKFVDRANGDYRLREDSPAVDVGATDVEEWRDPATTDTDLDGNPRVRGRGIDLGCYESAWSAERTATVTTPDPVPYAWLDGYRLDLHEGYEAAAFGTASNEVNKVWECYVAGLDPTNAASKLVAEIGMVDGAPVIRWSPDLNEGGTKAERVYTVEGKETLSDPDWGPTNAASRFFRVKVGMP